MNLLEFHDRLSSNLTSSERAKFFSEEVTIFNIINGNIRDEDIVNIEIDNKPIFKISVSNEDLACKLESRYTGINVVGAYAPIYGLVVTRDGTDLYFRLIET